MEKLSENMKRALMFTEPGDLMKGGPTRAALIRRGLVYSMDRSRGGQLTQDGLDARADLLKPPRRRMRFVVRKQQSGYTGAVSYVVYDSISKGRVSVHAMSFGQAKASADDLNIGDMVPLAADDPRPYDIRRAEAEVKFRQMDQQSYARRSSSTAAARPLPVSVAGGAAE